MKNNQAIQRRIKQEMYVMKKNWIHKTIQKHCRLVVKKEKKASAAVCEAVKSPGKTLSLPVLTAELHVSLELELFVFLGTASGVLRLGLPLLLLRSCKKGERKRECDALKPNYVNI